MRYLWVVLAVGLIVSACGAQAEPDSIEAQPPPSTAEVTTTVQLPGINTTYDSVYDIRSAVEKGGFVCSAWAVRLGDEFESESESASCAGVLVFTVYENSARIVEQLELRNDAVAIVSDVAHDLVGPNWSVTCEDRKDLCQALLPLLGGGIIVSDLTEE